MVKKHKSKAKYFRVRVINPTMCKKNSFRTLDIGRPKKHMLIRCKRKTTGKWTTQAYRLPKTEWRVSKNTLKPVTLSAKKMHKRITDMGRKKISRKGMDWKIKRG